MYIRLAALDTLKMLSCKSKVHEPGLVISPHLIYLLNYYLTLVNRTVVSRKMPSVYDYRLSEIVAIVDILVV